MKSINLSEKRCLCTFCDMDPNDCKCNECKIENCQCEDSCKEDGDAKKKSR
jgi:hypothetical protein